MTDEPSRNVGRLNGLRWRSLRLRLSLALRWCWLAARGSSWSARSLRYLSTTRGIVHRRLRSWEKALRPVIRDCMASERAARLVALFKKLESRYPWRWWVRRTAHCCQRVWMLAVARLRTGICWLQNWPAGNRFLTSLRNRWTWLVGQIGRSERVQWALGNYRRVPRWCGRLAPFTKALTSAWPSTMEITGEITGEIIGAAPAEKRSREPGVWADGDCPMGFACIVAEYFPPPESDLSGLPKSEKPEVAEFQPGHFLLDLFQAYSQLLEQRVNDSPKLAPVVPLVDVFALLSSVRSVSPEYSPDYTQDYSGDYTKEDFIKDVYRLHASGVDTTLDGARISFPISRGVKGKILTVTDEAGGERRYYGVRFLGQGNSG